MLLTAGTKLCGLVLIYVSLVAGVVTEGLSLSNHTTESTSPSAASGEFVVAIRLRDHDVDSANDSTQDQLILHQNRPPVRDCPNNPPVRCHRHTCLGLPDPPDAYRCRSRSTMIQNFVEITLFGCQCCPSTSPFCDEEICDGRETRRCKSELLMDCSCLLRDESPIYMDPVSIGVNPDTLVLDADERSTTPTEPPPLSLKSWAGFSNGNETISNQAPALQVVAGFGVIITLIESYSIAWNVSSSANGHGLDITKLETIELDTVEKRLRIICQTHAPSGNNQKLL